MNFDLYRVFFIAAKEGSLSKAAKELSITQPAVSHSIKQIEENMQVQLFFRTSKGVKLTQEGIVLFHYVEQAYQFLSIAEKKILEMNNIMSGEIKIGASDTLCKHYLLPHLEQFHNEYPDILIQVTNRTSPETLALLKKGDIDFGVVSLPIDDEHITIWQGPILQDIFVAGPKYYQVSQTPISLNDLKQYPLILLEKGTNTRNTIDHYAFQHNILLHPEIELGSIDLLVEFAKAGFGISCVIKNFIQDELNNQQLFEIPVIESIPARKIGIISLRDVPLTAAARAFLTQFKLSEQED